MPNLNEILSMLEDSVTGIEKTASEKEDKVEVPAGSETFTKTASAIKEAEELGAKVAAQLLKQAEDEKKEESKAEKKEGASDEGEEESKDEESEDEEVKSDKEEKMDKKASLVDIISAMLEKSATEGEGNTQNGVPAGVVPNQVQAETAAMVAGQDGVVGPTPGTNGNNDGGTVNQILDAIVAKAQASGGIGENQVPGGSSFSGAEMEDPNVEKTAAVVALVEAGIDFDSAVDLVKQAEYEINEDVLNIEKKAAFDALVEAGIDFNTATDLVKQAAIDLSQASRASMKAIEHDRSALGRIGNVLKPATDSVAGVVNSANNNKNRVYDAVKAHVASVKSDAGAVRNQIGALKEAWKLRNSGSRNTVRGAIGALGKNKAVQYGAGTVALGGVGAGGAYYAHQKKAAFDALVEEGIDFDTAAELVKQASVELYGK